MESNPWREAIKEACIVSWVPFITDDPELTLANLMQCVVAEALDPSISHAASALIDQGKRTALVCRKCGGAMHCGMAMETLLVGTGDLDWKAPPVTVSPGGPGRMVPCLKCVGCGYSIIV